VSVQEPGALPSVVYLILAYAFAVGVLGGYLFWSLRRMRGLERKQ
jgi:hypothetical protein